MTIQQDKNGRGARLGWAAATPALLALAAFSYVGVPFIPALCVYLDGRSRTYTAAVSVAVGAALMAAAFGPLVTAVGACVVLATLGAYLCVRLKAPFANGLLFSAVGGVLSMFALLLVYDALAGRPAMEAAAGWLTRLFAGFQVPGMLSPLDLLAVLAHSDPQASEDNMQLMMGLLSAQPPWLAAMSTADKVALVQPYLQELLAYIIPALAIVAGMLAGALGYYLPLSALFRRKIKAGGLDETPEQERVPAFASFKIPVYAVISLWLLQLVASMAVDSSWGNFGIVFYVVRTLLDALMVVQALALLSFLLNRRRVGGGVQALILVPVTVLFSWLLIWVGLFDALLNIRTVIVRVDELKRRGKQVFTPDGLEELRRMDEEKRKKDDKHDDDDWKDGDDE